MDAFSSTARAKSIEILDRINKEMPYIVHNAVRIGLEYMTEMDLLYRQARDAGQEDLAEALKVERNSVTSRLREVVDKNADQVFQQLRSRDGNI